MRYEDVLTSMRAGCDDAIARMYAVRYFEAKDARIRELESLLAEAREALEEIAALKAPPTLGDGIFAITSARATLSRLKPGEKGGA